MKYSWIGILALSGLLGFNLSWYVHKTDPGNIPITPTYHSPASFVKQLKGDPNAGRKIFKEFCISCHGIHPLIDIHAPQIGDKKTWNGLHQLGISTLLNMTIQGNKAMPARGGCFECSDKQLQETIEYILKETV